MGIFRSNPIADGEREVADLARRAERLEARITESESELATAQRVRREALLADEVDAGAVERATDNVHAIDLRIAGLVDGLAELGEQRRIAEAKLASAREQAARQATARLMSEAHARIQRTHDRIVEAAAEHIAALSAVSIGAPLAAHFGGLMKTFAGEVVGLLRQMEAHRETLLRGALPLTSVATIEPTSAVAIAPPAPIERARIYLWRPVRWREPDGSIAYAMKYAMVSPPAPVASKAVAAGVAYHADDPRLADLTRVYGIVAHAPSLSPLPDVLDLDAFFEPHGGEPSEEAA